jgi:flagellar biosynthesis component FlhA
MRAKPHVTDPVYGRNAIWIDASQAWYYRMLGYVVHAADFLVVLHVARVVRAVAHRLIAYEFVSAAVEFARKSHPGLVSATISRKLSIAEFAAVLRGVLEAGQQLGDMPTILEIIRSQETDDVGQLVKAVITGHRQSGD